MHLALRAGLLALAGTLMMLSGKSSRAQEDYRLSCKPPLKFMAGACVAACYSGYEDRGRWCEARHGGAAGGG